VRLFAFNHMDTTIELSDRDQATLAEYFRTWNATRSWMKTHPDSSYESAKASASAWLTKINVKAAVEAHLAEIHMSVEEATQRLSDIARGDVAQIMDVSSVGFNLDMATAKEKGLTKLIKKVRQKTTTYLAKSESQEDREVTELEVELYSAHDALRDIIKIKNGAYSQRSHAPESPPPGEIRIGVGTLLELTAQIEAHKAAAVDKARAIDTDTRSE
jgi:phage terminase small subunit